MPGKLHDKQEDAQAADMIDMQRERGKRRARAG
jgi:hypothetical protein